MKRLFLIVLVILTSFGSVFAEFREENKLVINGEQSLIFFASLVDVPESYEYIGLKYRNIPQGSALEDALKKLVYINKFPNLAVDFSYKKELNSYDFYSLAGKIFDIDFNVEPNKDILEKTPLIKVDLIFVEDIYNTKKTLAEPPKAASILGNKEGIFNDVYGTLLSEHYDKVGFSPDDLIYGALEGLASGAKDQHTVFFPPIENKNFEDSLAGEFEGIGAYVEMASPGVPRIVNPMPGSPAEKIGIKGGDIILKVGDRGVAKNNSLTEVTSWIKGPAGTPVNLTILRDGTELNFDVIRAKIIVKNIETKAIDYSTFLIKINTFGLGVADEFKAALDELKLKSGTKKVIIDLRNNGGGYLDQVTEMLSYLVPKGQNVAVVKYLGYNENIASKGYEGVSLSNYKVIILQNSGTASASEIMIGTIKDYFPNAVTIGENSFGKGSVQTLKEYTDGSSLKYTIAKWFTGKSQTGIDGVGINPDVILELDADAYRKDGTDNQLQRAINY